MKNISISNAENQIIIGSLLGDASLNKTDKKPRIHFSQCLAQAEYIQWKYESLINLTTGVGVRQVMSGVDKRYPQLRFQTRNHAIFNYYRKLFYPNGKKEVNKRVLGQLEPLGLAVWYMDDGNKILHKYTKKDGNLGIKSREICINTQCFTPEEHELMIAYFNRQYEIVCKMYKNKDSHRLVMNAQNANKFIAIIEPYILDSMKYKVDLQYC